jgi:SAM-dependent methyltransferase
MDINWEEMWRQSLKNTAPRGLPSISDEERYDYIAPLFKEWMEYDDYPSKLFERILIKPEWSVLDIGCGTGALAIPAAKKAQSVTAVDISTQMLKILTVDMEKNHLTNLRPMHLNWDNVTIGVDIHPHDVVIMSRSLGRTMNLHESLMKVNQAASRYAYITAWGGGERKMNRGIMEALGQEYQDNPDYLYVFNMLAQMGIQPNVEHLKCSSKVVYPTVDKALHIFQNLLHLSPSQLGIAADFLEDHLVKRDDGCFEIPDNKSVWSLIWWETTNSVSIQ